jgi:hypothetical protein
VTDDFNFDALFALSGVAATQEPIATAHPACPALPEVPHHPTSPPVAVHEVAYPFTLYVNSERFMKAINVANRGGKCRSICFTYDRKTELFGIVSSVRYAESTAATVVEPSVPPVDYEHKRTFAPHAATARTRWGVEAEAEIPTRLQALATSMWTSLGSDSISCRYRIEGMRVMAQAFPLGDVLEICFWPEQPLVMRYVLRAKNDLCEDEAYYAAFVAPDRDVPTPISIGSSSSSGSSSAVETPPKSKVDEKKRARPPAKPRPPRKSRAASAVAAAAGALRVGEVADVEAGEVSESFLGGDDLERDLDPGLFRSMDDVSMYA